MRRYFLAAVVVLAAPIPAQAVGFMTQLSCASDYYAYCSKHAVGSKELRSCMNANGPKLSKSCINALIADGEISKEEVARRREQLTAAKQPAKPEPQQAAKSVDAAKPDVAPANVARLPEPEALAKRQPAPARKVAAVWTLDQPTFDALKNRGNYFVASIDDVVPTSSEQSQSAVAARDVIPAVENAAADEIATSPAIAATVPPVAAAEALAPSEEKSVRPTEYPPGKMALGKKPAIEPPAPPTVDVVEQPRPSSSETWLNYMKNRFEGGMNYQGVDADF